MAKRIQSHLRGYIYRKKKYSIFLEEIDTETIIDYLYLKKIERIATDCKKIISNHIANYLIKMREEKEKINNKKRTSIDLIKAYLKGIIFRKQFKKDISSLKDIKDKIERYILGYKIKLILRSNNIQSLLIDIANIKYSLNNIDKNNDGANNQKIKELKTKLTKNINLFYFTFYQMKENSNWISQTKIKEPWIQKYMTIINKDKEKDNSENNKNNIFVKKQSIQSIYSNQKKIRRFKENNSKNYDTNKTNNDKKDSLKNYESNAGNDKDNNNTDSNKENTSKNNSNNNLIKENKDNNSLNNNSGDNKSGKNDDFNFYNSESEDSYEGGNRKTTTHKEMDTSLNNKKEKNDKSKKEKNEEEKERDDTNLKEGENINEEKDKKIRSNIVKRYKLKKAESEQQKLSQNHSKSLENKEDSKNENDNEKEKEKEKEKEIDILNEKENQKEEKEEDIAHQEDANMEKEKEKENKPKQLNKYEQREERPIKPMKNTNFLENENPFGLKKDLGENNVEKKNSIEKRYISSTRAMNRTKNTSGKNKKQNISEIEKEETIKTQEKTDLSLNEAPVSNKYIEYDNRPCGGGAKNNAMYDFSKYDESQPTEKLDRNERPLAGSKKIDYNAMFGEGGEDFEGDPFGGAKQYESNNKEKVKNVHKTNNVKKKPVYDARKAIEEAKLKEAKEGKKEKPSAFREFLREMKKISAEEKAQHNETNTENVKNEKISKNKYKKNDIKDNNLELNTDTNVSYSDKQIEKKLGRPDKKGVSRKKEKKATNIMNTENEEKDDISNATLEDKDKENTTKKKVRGGTTINKETNALRKKLHELERAPAPVLNIKGIKSRIECWGNNNDNKRSKINSLAPKSKDTPKSKDEQKNKNNNKGNEQKIISNYITNKKAKELSEANNNNTNHSLSNITKISKKMEEKIEKYVDKKLMQLNVQIEELDELFNIDKYFREKEEKMCQYINLPYIKQNYDFVVNYTNEDYDEKMNQIEKVYKELK